LAASVALVAACGGGGGGTTAPPTAPAANTSTINGINVPPEPEATGNAATLAGIDTNTNGVRDDVERSIAQNTPQTFADAMKVAKVVQQQVAGATAPTPAEQAEAFCLAARKATQADTIESTTLDSDSRLQAFYKNRQDINLPECQP